MFIIMRCRCSNLKAAVAIDERFVVIQVHATAKNYV